MSQQPLVESRRKSSQTQSLQPVLAAALASLEVQLDEELVRYRRAKAGAQTHPQPDLGKRFHQKTLERIDITPQGVQTQPQAAATTAPPPSLPSATKQLPAPPPPPAPPKIQTPSEAQIPQTDPDASAPSPSEPLNSPAVKTPEFSNLQDTTVNTLETNTANPPASAVGQTSGSIVPTTASQTQPDSITNTATNQKEPDDYLESSEQLLRSLSEEQQSAHSPQKTKKFQDNLLSPLGIGSMLLLVLASATLGVVVMNPGGLRQTPLGKIFASNSGTVAPDSAVTGSSARVTSNTRSQSNPPVAPIPKSPNLAQREFVDLNLDTVTTLQTKSQATPEASPTPTTASSTTAPAPTQTTPTKAVPQVPTTTRVQTIQMQPLMPSNLPPVPGVSGTQPLAPATQQPQNPKDLKPSATGWYHVVTDNAKPTSFGEIRKLVPDAYLSPKRTLIYVGAFKTVAEAEQRIKELEAQGIKARVAQP
ncbi:MAG: hypothetical protein VKL59_05090 [Nostocaceae cyanobacterium]|nr:hypothetical protein [Nostocaceae cyanobacterium]